MLAGIRLRRPIVLLPLLLVTGILGYIYILSPLLPHSWFSYATRPLWDHAEAPKEHIQHYYAEGMDTNELCGVHGWGKRANKAEVWDAVSRSSLVARAQQLA